MKFCTASCLWGGSWSHGQGKRTEIHLHETCTNIQIPPLLSLQTEDRNSWISKDIDAVTSRSVPDEITPPEPHTVFITIYLKMTNSKIMM